MFQLFIILKIFKTELNLINILLILVGLGTEEGFFLIKTCISIHLQLRPEYVLQRKEHLCMSNVDRIKVYDLVDLIKNNRNNITLEVRGELRILKCSLYPIT